MKLSTIDATDALPVRSFSVTDLADVVVIAGPNGVGKSRLINSLLQKFQSLNALPGTRLRIAATNATERCDWRKEELDTSVPGDVNLLAQTLQKNRSRRAWNSSVIHFESDRSIQQIAHTSSLGNTTIPGQRQLAGIRPLGDCVLDSRTRFIRFSGKS